MDALLKVGLCIVSKAKEPARHRQAIIPTLVGNPILSLDLLSQDADCHNDYKRERGSRRQNV
jgi:hypothetical protein